MIHVWKISELFNGMAQTCLISHHEKLGHTTDNFVFLPGSSRAGMIFGFCLKTGLRIATRGVCVEFLGHAQMNQEKGFRHV